ncbi:MAG: MarR family transcriptional regulator [Succinatimonas hippei]|nr:MarR family transcriptional regulator [Succinatimonas hippei]
MNPEDRLLLSNQLCFPMYRCARRIIRAYAPLLKSLSLTYTQYLVMMVLWERRKIKEKELCELLDLDSGTLSPLIRKLCQRGLLTKSRLEKDARVLALELTEDGLKLRNHALDVPVEMACAMGFDKDNAASLGSLKEQINALSEQLGKSIKASKYK